MCTGNQTDTKPQQHTTKREIQANHINGLIHCLLGDAEVISKLQFLNSLTSMFLWCGCRGKRSRHSRRMRNPQLFVAGKRPMGYNVLWHSNEPDPTHNSLSRSQSQICHIKKDDIPVWLESTLSTNQCLGSKSITSFNNSTLGPIFVLQYYISSSKLWFNSQCVHDNHSQALETILYNNRDDR